MTYDFKPWHEAGWAAVIAVTLTLLQNLILFDATAITDWRLWTITLVGACIRAAAAAALASLRRLFGIS